MLGLMAPDYLDREVYCCGPEPFMQAVRDALAGLGFDMDMYHQESFGAPVETEADQPDLDDVVLEDDSMSEITFFRIRCHSKGGANRYCFWRRRVRQV